MIVDGPDRDPVAALLAEQGSGGGFRCTIEHPSGAIETDQNGFATALVLRRLGKHHGSAELAEARRKALDFLERCAAPGLAGAFSFWPPDERPAWGHRVGPDVDDTAVISLELWRGGRLSLSQIGDTARDVLGAAVVTELRSPHPPWMRPMVFPTWLGPAARRSGNPIDCAVNANVVALMAASGAMDLPGYAEAIGMIGDAVAGVAAGSPGHRWLRLRTLTPYYPDPGLFLSMVDHAIECGAIELRATRDEFRGLLCAVPVPPAARGALCSNAYGGPVWRCRALALVETARASAARQAEARRVISARAPSM